MDPRLFRRSDNIEDRRHEHFGSMAQAPQMPNVFTPDGNMIGLNWQDDFAQPGPLPPVGMLGQQAGAGVLQAAIDKYLAARAPGPVVHSFDEQIDPNGPPVALDRRK